MHVLAPGMASNDGVVTTLPLGRCAWEQGGTRRSFHPLLRHDGYWRQEGVSE